MDRINSQGTVLVNGVRMRAPRNTATGVPGTELDFNYDNGLQEEMMAIISNFGMTPSPNNLQQILTCLLMLPRVGNILVLTTTPTTQGSFTVPADVTVINGIFTAPGGGSVGATETGGSGLGGVNGCSGPSGGAGATLMFSGAGVAGLEVNYNLGPPGIAGPNGTNALAGGNCSLTIAGQTMIIPGGQGGAGINQAGNQSGGLGGGRGVNQFSGNLPANFVGLRMFGGDGTDGMLNSNLMAGNGGVSFWGGGGRGSTSGGEPGAAWGSGAGGGYGPNGTTGATGANGVLVVWG